MPDPATQPTPQNEEPYKASGEGQYTAEFMDEEVMQPQLAPYATDWRTSRGRVHPQSIARDRTPFQRDRDRIVHSSAFRRLQYKTQVFINQHEGDLYRTRLTHTLEVAQLTRTMCRALALDEDLGETVALAHDLGHPPFGHAGEDALNKCMVEYGGFRHNDQTLRILRQLECRYGAFDGLNLTWESLEGIAKHNGPLPADCDEALYGDLEPQSWCGLEAQVAALADDIAYNHHDLDDALTTGTLRVEDALALPQFRRTWEEVTATFPRIDDYRKIKETIRRMINRQVRNLLVTTRANIQHADITNADDVRALDHPLVANSAEFQDETKAFKVFLFERMYRHYRMNRMAFRSFNVVQDLFGAFMNHKRLLPENVQQLLGETPDDKMKARVVADYVSEMTDRSAMMTHARLFGSSTADGMGM